MYLLNPLSISRYMSKVELALQANGRYACVCALWQKQGVS